MSAGLTGFAATNWNNVATASGTAGSLTDDSGTATGASVTWGAGGVWGDSAADGDADLGIGDAILARGYLDDQDTGGGIGNNFDVTGISFTTYSVVLYYSTDGTGVGYRDATVNGTTSSTTGARRQYQNPNWDASNTIVFTGLSGNLDVDVLSGPSGGERGSLAGFQIVDTTIPEPSSTALLGLGGLALILRRRK